MTPIQWLLIGGLQHGKTVWMKYGSRVLADQDQLYEGENYLHEGKLYRIGSFMATGEQRAQIDNLIRQNRLTPLSKKAYMRWSDNGERYNGQSKDGR